MVYTPTTPGPWPAVLVIHGGPPTDDHESTIVANLAPGSYTAIVRDSDAAGGVALVEVYALPND